jgi:hypothetical protein
MKLSREKTLPPRSEEREERKTWQFPQCALCLSARFLLIRRTIHPFAVFSNGCAAAFSED